MSLLKIAPTARERAQRRRRYFALRDWAARPLAVSYEGQVRRHRVGAAILAKRAGESAEKILAALGPRPDPGAVRNLLETLDPL